MDTYLAIIGGLVLLAGGGNLLVRGAVALARSLGLSPLLIGLTLVGFGTSSPELVTSVTAALQGSAGIAVGNIIGSNIANILLILGIAGLMAPIHVSPDGFGRDAFWLAASAAVLVALALAGSVGRLVGAAMLVALALYVTHVAHGERRPRGLSQRAGEALGERSQGWPSRPLPAAAVAATGIVALVAGSVLLVRGATDLAFVLGVPETIIGLTIVAVGTSLPEMTTSLVAALQRQTDIAYGNVVGSNIFNILFILGASAIAAPFGMPPEIAQLDIWVLLAATGVLVFFGWTGFRLNRIEAAVFVAAYVAYVAYLAFGIGPV
ncbi:MAG: calcium/sodium antiporter [Rhizobiaceae bacterium]|nr:calcium/sodium antiporter [Rhizobiaceae bacterium]